MRIRSIKPEYWRSDDIDALSWDERLVFIGLWSYVDDNGVGLDKLSAICADLFAGDMERDPRDTLARVATALDTFVSRGLIARYTVGGKAYLFVTGWSQHQRVDRPNKPRYPLPTSDDAEIRDTLATPSREVRETPSTGTGEQRNRGTEEQGKERAPRKRGATPEQRACRLPDDWAPSDELVASMREELPHVDLGGETKKFVDYWRALPGAKARKLDWDATWRNWLRRASPTPPQRPGAPPGISKQDAKVRNYLVMGGVIPADDPNPPELKAIS